jgi:hypothetical protein
MHRYRITTLKAGKQRTYKYDIVIITRATALLLLIVINPLYPMLNRVHNVVHYIHSYTLALC